MIGPGQRSALFYGTVAMDDDTKFAISSAYGFVWIGDPIPGRGDLNIFGTPQAFENLAAALMLAATEMREAHLVAALAPSGPPSQVSA